MRGGWAPGKHRVPARLGRIGIGVKLVVDGGRAEATSRLLELLGKAHALREALLVAGKVSLTAFAKGNGMARSRVSRHFGLTLLAPDIVEDILAGRHPAMSTADRPLGLAGLPHDWQGQRSALGYRT